MNINSKIFVAGGTGMVGSAIIKRLIDKGYNNIISNYHIRKPSVDSNPSVTFYPLDLTRQSDTETFFALHKPEYVFLSAAKVGGILANDTYKAQFIYENIVIASNIIHASYIHGVKKLLNLGSSCIYPKLCPQPMKEEYLLTGPLEPTNEPYAIAKIAAIKLCRYYNEQYGTNFMSCMPTNLYGPNDNFNLETSHALPALIRKFHLARLLKQGDMEGIKKDLQSYPVGFGVDKEIDFSNPESLLQTLEKIGIKINFTEHNSAFYSQTLNNEQKTLNLEHRTLNLEPRTLNNIIVTLWGTGEVYREFLHVYDLADACIFLMENIDAWDLSRSHPKNGLKHKNSNSVLELKDYFVNVGSGIDLTIKDLSYLIKDIVGFKGVIEQDPSKPDGTPKKLLDVTNMNKLGWQPAIVLEEGIKKTYEWYLTYNG